MSKWIARLGASAAILALSTSLAVAGPGKGKPAAAPTCPACKMTLSAKKTDKTPIAVKVGKRTYYCCAGCDMAKYKNKKGVIVLPKS